MDVTRRWNLFHPAVRKEVTRLGRFLKWFRRFWFRLKIELECGFNSNLES